MPPLPPEPRQELLSYLGFLRASARAMARDDSGADDLMHTTIEKAWHNIDRFEPGTNMQAWLFTIMRNTHFSERRAAARRRAHARDPVRPGAPDQIAEVPAHVARLGIADLRDAIAALPCDQRVALLLVGACGMSYEEAAQACCVPVGTVKSRMNRARCQLAVALGTTRGTSLIRQDKHILAVLNAPAPCNTSLAERSSQKQTY